MDDVGGPEDVRLVARRIDFLEQVRDRAHRKRDLVEELDHSRSTVDRAIRDLEDAELVERTGEGYRATVAGRLAAERYRAFLADERDVLDARDVLASLPPDCDLPGALLSGATVETLTDSYRLFEHLADLLRNADRYRAVLGRLTDSRHLRLCHDAVVRGDLHAEFVLGPSLSVRLRTEFPRLASELADADAFTAFETETPPYGLVLADGPESATVVCITYDEDGVVGLVRNDSDAAVAWARERCDALVADATDATAAFAESESDDEIPALTRGRERLPGTLRSEGFTRVDDAYFDRREPAPLTTGWRAGLGLPEVAAGYAVERERETDDGRRPVSAELLDHLEAGTDVALVGPPGSGKSTLCKQVACRWHERGYGPVYYREAGVGGPFESVGALEGVLDGAGGHALVVVEDAVRGPANAVFEVVQAFSGREDVTFLLDAREQEWRDPDELPTDARLEAFRRGRIETVQIPALDEAECRRAADQFEVLTGDELGVDVTEVLADVRADRGEESVAGSETFLLFHRLARYADPLGDRATPTTIDGDVDRLRADLASIGDLALDAGVVINLCNATGITVHREFAHALVAADAPDPRADHGAIRAALDRMEGHVLFPAADGTLDRTVHESWSARFLARLLDDGTASARRRFGRCVTRLLALADDVDRRERVARAAGGETPGLAAVVADPGSWADETAESVFRLGDRYPRLAPLYGTDTTEAIEFPEACSAETVLACVRRRGEMNLDVGEFDAAAAILSRVVDAVTGPVGREDLPPALSFADLPDPDVDGNGDGGTDGRGRGTDGADDELRTAGSSLAPATAVEVLAKVTASLGTVARREGDLDRAATNYRVGWSLARAVGAHDPGAYCLRGIAGAAQMRGAYDAAEAYLSVAIEACREVGDTRGEGQCLNLMAIVAAERGDYDEAERCFEEALAAFRAVGNRKSVGSALNNLGKVAVERGDLDDAEEYLRRGLDRRLESGWRVEQVSCLLNLAEVATERGDLDDAVEYGERALEISRETDAEKSAAGALASLVDPLRERGALDRAAECADEARACYEERGITPDRARARLLRGTVADARGDLDAAAEDVADALELARGVEYAPVIARSLAWLARVERERGNLEPAREYAKESRERFEALDSTTGLAEVDRIRGRLAIESGALDAAAESLETSLDRAREAGSRLQTAKTLGALGELAHASGDPAAAVDDLERAATLGREFGATLVTLAAIASLVDVHDDDGNLAGAIEWCETGVELASEAGLDERRETFARRRARLADGRDEQDDGETEDSDGALAED